MNPRAPSLAVKLCWGVLVTLLAVLTLATLAFSENVAFVVHGFPNETATTKTVDALSTALRALSDVGTLKVTRPSACAALSGELRYKNKQDLLAQLTTTTTKQTTCVLFFIGHAARLTVTDAATSQSTKHYGLEVSGASGSARGIFAQDIAGALSSSVKSVALYADSCWAEAFLNETQEALQEKGITVTLSIASAKKDQRAVFWDQDPVFYWAFTAQFLKSYYIQLTDPNAIQSIRNAATEAELSVLVVLMHQAFKDAKEMAKERAKTDAVEIKAPSVSVVSPTKTPLIHIRPYTVKENKKEYYGKLFVYRVVKDTASNKYVVSGYLGNESGLALAPLLSSPQSDCSTSVSFNFSLEGAKHSVVLKKEEGVYTLKIDGKEYTPEFQKASAKLEIAGKTYYVYMYPKFATLLRVRTKNGYSYRTIYKKEYDPSVAVFAFKVKIKGQEHKIEIRFKATGGMTAFIDSVKYHETTMRHLRKR